MDECRRHQVNNTIIKVLNVDVRTRYPHQIARRPKGVEVTAQLQRRCQRPYPQRYPILGGQTTYRPNGVTGRNLTFRLIYRIHGGQKARETKDVFVVQDIPPIAAIGQSGLRLNLIGQNDRILNVSSPVLGERILRSAKVESAQFRPVRPKRALHHFHPAPTTN